MGGRKKNTKAIINNFSLLSGLSKSYETLGFFFVEFINVRIGKGYIGSSDDIFIYAYSCPAIFAIAAGYQNSGECTSAFVTYSKSSLYSPANKQIGYWEKNCWGLFLKIDWEHLRDHHHCLQYEIFPLLNWFLCWLLYKILLHDFFLLSLLSFSSIYRRASSSEIFSTFLSLGIAILILPYFM